MENKDEKKGFVIGPFNPETDTSKVEEFAIKMGFESDRSWNDGHRGRPHISYLLCKYDGTYAFHSHSCGVKAIDLETMGLINENTQAYPRVMMVGGAGFRWRKRVVLAKTKKGYMVLSDIEDIEKAGDGSEVVFFPEAKEAAFYSKAKIAELLGVDVDSLYIK